MANILGSRVKTFVFAATLFLLIAGFALAQETGEASTQAPATTSELSQPAQPVSSIMLDKIDWVINDMVRCVEELRRTQNQWDKRYLVEQVEETLYREVEFPMLYQQVVGNEKKMDVVPIGSTSDVTYGSDANPLAPKYAEAFALVGIAKGYEGYSAAATDYILRARDIYKDVLSLKVKLDSFEDYKTLSQWMADSRGTWGGTQAVRVTFNGKNVLQDVVDSLNMENVKFQANAKSGEKIDDYYLYVAKRDFLKGLRTRIATDDPLKKDRENKFNIYLPPGKYKLFTSATADYGIDIEVQNDPNRNQFVVETIQNGIAVYPLAAMRGGEKLLKEEKKKEQAPEEQKKPEEGKGGPTGGGTN